MTTLFPSILGFLYFFSEIGILCVKRSRLASSKQTDRVSFKLVWTVITIAVACTFAVQSFLPDATLPHRLEWCVSGVFVFLIGIFLRWWSLIRLGRFFTLDVVIHPDHRVITDGPYAFVRHPTYTGILLAFLGLGLALGNWVALPVLIIPITAILLYRIHCEEETLFRELGKEYEAYARKRKRLVPFIW